MRRAAAILLFLLATAPAAAQYVLLRDAVIESSGSAPTGACVAGTQPAVLTPSDLSLTWCNGGTWATISLAGGNPSFAAVTAGTNAAALRVGTDGSLAATGSGTITATAIAFSGVTSGSTSATLGLGGPTTISGDLTITRGRVLLDLDRDGLPDYAFVGDFDADGDMDDQDINAAQVALTDSTRVLELAAGTFTLDADADGNGDTHAATGWNPHVRLRSGTTLRGQGQDVTILQLNAATSAEEGYGNVPLIGTDSTGQTTTDAAARITDVHVEKLTAQTTVATSHSVTTPFVPGVAMWDCDRCSIDRVTVRRVPQAAFHLSRCTDTLGSNLYGYRAGNYDTDGTGVGDAPGNLQPCFYLYTSRGFIQTDVGFVDSKCEQTGGVGVNVRTATSVKRVVPLGEDSYLFDATHNRIAQVFQQDTTTDGNSRISGISVWLRKRAGATPTGTLEIALQTVDGSNQPSGTAVTGYDFTDFDTFAASATSPTFSPYRFARTSSDATATVLTASTRYAIVLRYTAADSAQPVYVAYDSGAVTDTYAGGAAYYGTTDTPTTALGANQDLNFAVENGMHVRPFVRNVVVSEVSGVNGTSGPCLSLGGSLHASVVGLTCTKTDNVEAGLTDFAWWPQLRNLRVTEIPTTASQKIGMRFGAYAPGGVVEKSFVLGATSTSGCYYLSAWARDATFEGLHAERCTGSGIAIHNGSRNITFRNSTIFGTGTYGIELSKSASDTDGVLAEWRNIVIEKNVVKGTGTYGLLTASDHVHRGLFIRDNVFEDTGLNGIDLYGAATTEGPYAVTGNTINGWATSGTTSYALRIREGGMRNLLVSGNTMMGKSPTGGQERCISFNMTGTNANYWTIANNSCSGSVTTLDIYSSKTAGKQLTFRGNMPDGTVTTTEMSVLSDRVQWGPGSAGFDAVLQRIGIGQVGTPAGDELVGTAGVRVGGTAGPVWTSGTAAPGTCAAGDLFSDTNGFGTACGGSACYLAVCGPADTWTYLTP